MPKVNTKKGVVMSFSDLLRNAVNLGQIPTKNKDSINWFSTFAKGIKTNSSNIIRANDSKYVNFSQLSVGSMYCFMYDPKHKNTLPYYDMFPCIFVLEKYPDGSILGLNFHYLGYGPRTKLMDILMTNCVSNPVLAEVKKMQISYTILKKLSKTNLYKPCIKKYLHEHVRSKFVKVDPTEWVIAAFLPSHEFAKASATKVWQESKANV